MENEVLHPLNEVLIKETNKFVEQFSKQVLQELEKIQKDAENLTNVLKHRSMGSTTKP